MEIDNGSCACFFVIHHRFQSHKKDLCGHSTCFHKEWAHEYRQGSTRSIALKYPVRRFTEDFLEVSFSVSFGIRHHGDHAQNTESSFHVCIRKRLAKSALFGPIRDTSSRTKQKVVFQRLNWILTGCLCNCLTILFGKNLSMVSESI